MMGGVKGELEIEKTQIFVWTEVRIMIYAKFYIFMFFLFMQWIFYGKSILFMFMQFSHSYISFMQIFLFMQKVFYLSKFLISVYAKNILFK